ncbi:MAG: hypothetical protein KDJ52_31425 [Anaerolineae bacterium]|nr:hypothetical protein [Anaerolineae bacterium]
MLSAYVLNNNEARCIPISTQTATPIKSELHNPPHELILLIPSNLAVDTCTLKIRARFGSEKVAPGF